MTRLGVALAALLIVGCSPVGLGGESSAGQGTGSRAPLAADQSPSAEDRGLASASPSVGSSAPETADWPPATGTLVHTSTYLTDESGDPNIDGDAARFTMPSGNITCALYPPTADEAAMVMCQLVEYNYDPDPEEECASAAWRPNVVVLQDDRVSAGICAGDQPLPERANVLPYDTSIALHGFVCLSQNTGLTCWNTQTRHGFAVSRSALVKH